MYYKRLFVDWAVTITMMLLTFIGTHLIGVDFWDVLQVQAVTLLWLLVLRQARQGE